MFQITKMICISFIFATYSLCQVTLPPLPLTSDHYERAILDAQRLLQYSFQGEGEGEIPRQAFHELQTALKISKEMHQRGDLTGQALRSAINNLYDACVLFEIQARVANSTSIDTLATKETKYLFQNLKELSPDHLIYGMQDATGYGVGWNDDDDRSDVKDVCGSYPGMFSWDVYALTRDGHYDRFKYRFELAYRHGAVNTLCWHQYDPLGRSFYSKNVDHENVVQTLLPQGEYHEYYLEKLEYLAFSLKSLRGDHGESIPVIFRPYHEHDGGWFWWGAGQCTTEEYNEIWRFTYHYLTDSLNVHNLLWAISPNHANTEEKYLSIFPGHDYVDVYGMDHYFNGESIGQDQVLDFIRKLRVVSTLAANHDKLAGLTEVGYEGIPLDSWHTNVLLDPLKRDPVASRVSYAAVWRNANTTHHYAPYPGHTSVPDFLEFYQDPYTLFSLNMPKIYFHNFVEPDYGDIVVPNGIDLQQNYPNPFNPGTEIPYEIEGFSRTNLSIQIYDIRGQKLKSFQRKHEYDGDFSVHWDGVEADGEPAPAGVYIYQLATQGIYESRKMVLLR